MITKNNKSYDKITGQTPLKIFLRFLRFGLLAWGGPIAQIAMIKQELVDEEKWITREQFNRTLAVYQALPGPEAHELCVYFGMVAGGRFGGLLAGLGFMLPGFIFMLLLTLFYINVGINSVLALFILSGFQIAAVGLIIRATHRISRHAITNVKLFIIAVLSAIAYFLDVSFLIVLPISGIIHSLIHKPTTILPIVLMSILALSFSGISSEIDIVKTNSSQLEIFLSGLKGGLLTFGGAYTVIPFIQQDAVINNSWMTNQQFLDGIALSGILPAPLIIFTTFVGYFAGGWTGSFIITFGIFLPAFCFTLLGHNYLQKLIENTTLHNFLDGVTASVIGLIGVTSVKLFLTAISDLYEFILFAVILTILYVVKSKYVVIYVIAGAGLLSLIYRTL